MITWGESKIRTRRFPGGFSIVGRRVEVTIFWPRRFSDLGDILQLEITLAEFRFMLLGVGFWIERR